MGDTTAQQNALLGTWGNMRRAVTTTYTVASADKGWTIACGGGASYTITVNSASGYDANFQVVILNEDASNNKTIAITGGQTFVLAPGSSATLYNQNSVWQRLGAYSEGVWTPGLAGTSTAGSPTYTIQVGSYEQSGRGITARFTIATTALGGPTGNMQVTGLPFTSTNTTNDYGGGPIWYMSGVTLDSSYTTLTCVVLPNNNTIQLYEIGSGVSGQAAPVGKFAAATVLEGFVRYNI